MLESLITIILGASVMMILFFAYMSKTRLASYVAYTILAAYAISMALSGLVGFIVDVDFLSFLVSILEFLDDIIVFIEVGVILFLFLMSKHKKTKIMPLKVAIMVYVVLRLLLEFGIL